MTKCFIVFCQCFFLNYDVRNRLDCQEEEIVTLRKENVNLHHRVSQLERYTRRKNAIIFGVADQVEASIALATIAREKLGLQNAPAVATAYRIGKQGAARRPILVKFCSEQGKALIMSNVSKLKGTKISINDDLTPEEQAVRRTIVQALKFAKSKGIENCKVRRTGLLVNGHLVPVGELCNETWLTNRLSGEEERLTPRDKRSHAEVQSPTFAEAAAGEGFFSAARSNQQNTPSKGAGNQARGRSSSKKTRTK
jgi:hypothetical protein